MNTEKKKQIYWNTKKSAAFRNQDTQLLYQINQLLLERNLLQPKQSILIAVSGGQDSICLLNLLYKLQPKWRWKLAIVHCDHKWSSSSLFQAKHMSYLATNMQIHYYQAITIQCVDTEQLARVWRYKILNRIAILHNYQVIVTAHNGSDRVETIIHNMVRGSGFNGLQSLGWKRKIEKSLKIHKNWKKKKKKNKSAIFRWHYTKMKLYTCKNEILLIRPFLNITRIELHQIIQKWKLPVYFDSSNQNWKIRRNRIRNQLLPYLRKYFNPKVDYVLNSLAELVHADFLYLETITNCIVLQNHSYNMHNFSYKKYAQLNLHLIQVLPVAVQRRILKRFLDNYTGTSIKFQHVEQIRNCVTINIDFSRVLNYKKRVTKKSFLVQKHVDLPNKIQLFISNNCILLSRQSK